MACAHKNCHKKCTWTNNKPSSKIPRRIFHYNASGQGYLYLYSTESPLLSTAHGFGSYSVYDHNDDSQDREQNSVATKFTIMAFWNTVTWLGKFCSQCVSNIEVIYTHGVQMV